MWRGGGDGSYGIASLFVEYIEKRSELPFLQDYGEDRGRVRDGHGDWGMGNGEAGVY